MKLKEKEFTNENLLDVFFLVKQLRVSNFAEPSSKPMLSDISYGSKT